MRGDRRAKRSSFGKTLRKRLSDITNYQPQPKSPPVFDQILPHDASSSSTKHHIDHLLKENAGLMKLITDKNKVIESNGVELQQLRVTLQKTQLQNWNIAQSNSHMLAELNLGKKKLKAVQHQLICVDALLKTKNLELEAQRKMKDQKGGSQDGGDADTKQHDNTNRRRRLIRSHSIGPLNAGQISEKETFENKRHCVRRQSARFRSQEPKENLFEMEDLKMHEDGPTSMVVNEQKDGKCSSESKPQESQRMSFGRPSRRAAEKMQSYKETPLNIKIRRPE